MSVDETTAGVVYEVAIDLDAAIEDAYRAWVPGHVAALLALPGFVDAQVFDVLDPPPAAGRVYLCMQFGLHDEAALQAYLDHHAARMRADGVARFGGRFVATRRVLRRAQR